MTPDTNSTEALDIAVEPCADCSATTRWERRDLSPTSEVWLGTCEECGSMQVVALGVPDPEIADPLGFYLTGDAGFKAPAARPAWQRFYALTTAAPFFLTWSFTATLMRVVSGQNDGRNTDRQPPVEALTQSLPQLRLRNRRNHPQHEQRSTHTPHWQAVGASRSRCEDSPQDDHRHVSPEGRLSRVETPHGRRGLTVSDPPDAYQEYVGMKAWWHRRLRQHTAGDAMIAGGIAAAVVPWALLTLLGVSSSVA